MKSATFAHLHTAKLLKSFFAYSIISIWNAKITSQLTNFNDKLAKSNNETPFSRLLQLVTDCRKGVPP